MRVHVYAHRYAERASGALSARVPHVGRGTAAEKTSGPLATMGMVVVMDGRWQNPRGENDRGAASGGRQSRARGGVRRLGKAEAWEREPNSKEWELESACDRELNCWKNIGQVGGGMTATFWRHGNLGIIIIIIPSEYLY